MRLCWVNFQCRGVLLIWIIVGQGPTALAMGAGGGCLVIFFLSSIISLVFLSPSLWETTRYRLKYCLKGPLSPKQPTNQPNLNDAKGEFEVEGTSAVFSTWRVEVDGPLDIGDVDFADSMHARAGRLALNARMTDVRAAQLLAALPEGNFVLRHKFLREKDEDWVLEDKFDPVRTEQKKGQEVIEISRNTKPGVLIGIDSVLPKCLPCHRSCLRPLPHQRPGPCQPCSVERRRSQLRGTEGCGTLRGRPERPGAYTHTTAENTGVGGESSRKWCIC